VRWTSELAASRNKAQIDTHPLSSPTSSSLQDMPRRSGILPDPGTAESDVGSAQVKQARLQSPSPPHLFDRIKRTSSRADLARPSALHTGELGRGGDTHHHQQCSLELHALPDAQTAVTLQQVHRLDASALEDLIAPSVTPTDTLRSLGLTVPHATGTAYAGSSHALTGRAVEQVALSGAFDDFIATVPSSTQVSFTLKHSASVPAGLSIWASSAARPPLRASPQPGARAASPGLLSPTGAATTLQPLDAVHSNSNSGHDPWADPACGNYQSGSSTPGAKSSRGSGSSRRVLWVDIGLALEDYNRSAVPQPPACIPSAAAAGAVSHSSAIDMVHSVVKTARNPEAQQHPTHCIAALAGPLAVHTSAAGGGKGCSSCGVDAEYKPVLASGQGRGPDPVTSHQQLAITPAYTPPGRLQSSKWRTGSSNSTSLNAFDSVTYAAVDAGTDRAPVWATTATAEHGSTHSGRQTSSASLSKQGSEGALRGLARAASRSFTNLLHLSGASGGVAGDGLRLGVGSDSVKSFTSGSTNRSVLHCVQPGGTL
jgi:hypothetical protein